MENRILRILKSNVTLTLPDWIDSEVGDALVCSTDDEQMELAVRLAERNVAERTGGPFGAAVFEIEGGALAAVGVNRVVPLSCSVAHAEAMAIMLAQQTFQTYDLAASDLPPLRLVTSAQPCLQCFGMIWWSGVREVLIGATAEDVERLTGFSEGALPEEWVKRFANRVGFPAVRVTEGLLRERALEPLIEYRKRNGAIYSPSST